VTPAVARRTLAYSLLRNALLVHLLGVGVAALGGGLALLGRPEATAAGPSFAFATVLASVGTSMTAIALAGPLVASYVTRVRLERSGASAGLAQLGVGERDLARALLPTLAALSLLGGTLVWWAEPPAWSAVHGLKGSPAATAAFLGRLNAGEALSTGDSGLVLVAANDALQIWGRSGWTASALAISPHDQGWSIKELQVQGTESDWRAETVRLRPVREAGPPTSPLTRSMAELLQGSTERDRLVLHRRLSLPVLGVLLGLIAWLAGAGPAGVGPGARLGGLVLGAVLILRTCDLGVASGTLPGALAGWLPSAAMGGLLLLSLRTRR
jgi:hypothetical protein